MCVEHSDFKEFGTVRAVTRERLYLDAMQQIFSSTTKVLVDTRSSSPLLVLPFDKLLQQPAGDASAHGGSGAAPSGGSGGKESAGEPRLRETVPGARDRESR